MPWVTINILEVHSDDKKRKLHQSTAKAVAEALEIPIDWVKIQIIEINPKDHSIGGVSADKL
jgi:phenylpyruvate tautomerase PptA (4-oxalocrotonate tautomerase family)